MLQINAADTTYATTVYGSDDGHYSPSIVAFGSDCVWDWSRTREGVIDLRGTPYVIAGVNDTPCLSSSIAGGTFCFQWQSFGHNPAMTVTCSDLCAILAPVVVREIWIALSVSDEFKPQLDAGVAPKLRSAAEIMSIHEHKCNPIVKRVL